MQFLKLKAIYTPRQLVLVGVMTVSIALTLPALAEQKPIDAQRSAAQTSPIRMKSGSSPSSADNNAALSSYESFDISWKVIAGLGLLSGFSALVWSWKDFRPRGAEARKRLKDLGAWAQSVQRSLDGLNELKDQAARREQKVTQEISRLSLLDSASKKELADLRSSYANLSIQLRLIHEQMRSASVQTLDTSIIVPDSPEPSCTPETSPPPEIPEQLGCQVTALYLSAVLSNDRNRIRSIAKAELNITQSSEEALTRATTAFATQLQSVPGGGSYLLIEYGSKYWICPTVQTLTSFTTIKPLKGIFDYEGITSVSTAELKQPAEAEQIRDGIWQVVSKGIVLVPA